MIDYRFGYEEEGELKQKGLFFSPNSSSILLTKNQFPIFEYVSYDKIQDLYEQGKGHFYFIPDGFEPVLVPNDIKDQTVTNLLQSTKPVSTAPNVSRMLLDTDVRLPSYALPCTVNNNTDNDQDDNNQDKSTTTTTNAGATKKPPLSPSSLLLPDKKPPRPPNAFILYRRAKQPSILAKNNGGISNNDVSKEIGKMWHEEPEDIRLKYQKMAETAKQEHMKKYPEYRYKPRRPEEKKRRRSSKSSSQTQHENNGKGLLLGEGHEELINKRHASSTSSTSPSNNINNSDSVDADNDNDKNEKSNKDVDKFNKIDTTTIKDRNEKVSRIILNEENNNNNGNVDEAFIITKIKELTTLKKNLFQKLRETENLKLKSVEKNHHCLNDGYENNITSNIIPRAIILNPKLVTLWKNNGYKDIFHDYNDLVLKATYLMLFPPTIFNNNNNTNIPDLTKVVSRLREFVNLGFKLTKLVMGDVLLLFENELSMIGELILKSFQIFRNEDIQQILEYCLVQILMPEKGLKNLTILEFLYEKLENPEESFLKVLNKYNIGNQYCDCDCGRNHGDNSNRFIRLFSLNLSVYSWIFKKFESDSRVTSRCFDEILLARYYMDSQSILTHIKMEQDESLKTIFETFDKLCKQFFFSEIPYKTYHLKYLIKSDESVLLNRFFRKFIPNLFKIKKNSKTLIFNTELQVNWYEKLSKVKSNLEYYNDNNLFKSQFNQFGEKLSKMKILSELPPFSNCSSIKRPVNGESNFKQANKKKIKIT
ncbi:24779_t:CDS:2 [Entrophospora sp. SA101]|nr:24779_t:CDS:2 [Entrophospora sp. SA101]